MAILRWQREWQKWNKIPLVLESPPLIQVCDYKNSLETVRNIQRAMQEKNFSEKVFDPVSLETAFQIKLHKTGTFIDFCRHFPPVLDKVTRT